MITPTIGRVVLIRRKEAHSVQPEAGIVAFVHNDRLINVAGFNANGAPFSMTSLLLVQDEEMPEEGDCAYWMPYQKGQAAKTEALEKRWTPVGAESADKSNA
jgi:hypothetical protein